MASEELVHLRHGTTRKRAEAILLKGPDLSFREPGALDVSDGFSAVRVTSACPYGSPEAIALGKARLFPDEGGPAIVEFDIPESIVLKAEIKGEVRFARGYGLEELLTMWPFIAKKVRLL